MRQITVIPLLLVPISKQELIIAKLMILQISLLVLTKQTATIILRLTAVTQSRQNHVQIVWPHLQEEAMTIIKSPIAQESRIMMD